jgi:Rod binding domain-containing protein
MTDLAITNDGQLNVPTANSHTRLVHAAQQFEASFIQLLFQTGDTSDSEDPPLLGGSSADTQFKELFRSGLSEKAAGHLGIAQMLERQIEGHGATTHHPGTTQR